MDIESPPEEEHNTTALGKRKWSPPEGEFEPGTLTSRSTTENHEDTATSGTLSPLDTNLSSKRARTTNSSTPNTAVDQHGPIMKERRRFSQLPPEVLQHILSFLDPVSLGCMLCVNQIFHALLDPNQNLPAASAVQGCLSLRAQNTIWVASRKRFLQGFPRPLDDMLELDMWKLLRGNSCQFCGKKGTNQASSIPSPPWSAGPGPDGVRVIWPFAIRSCGSCLGLRLVKEAELMFSSFPSFLQPGLPYAYFTPSLHFVTSISLRLTPAPSGLLLTRYFFRGQMEKLQKEMDEVRPLGSGAAEGWCKGLETTGRDKISDAARFEQWEATGGFQALTRTGNSSRVSTHSPALPPMPIPGLPARIQNQSHSSGSRTGSPIGMQHRPSLTGISLSVPGPISMLPSKPSTPAPGQQSTGFNTNHAPGTLPFPKPMQHHRPERNLRDVAQIKADRRAEIERRCLELDSPIMPSTLVHMDAFSAALQISMPLNDNAWEVLKGRLLSERDVALQKEGRTANKDLQLHPNGTFSQTEQLKPERENVTPDWEEIQRPVREKLDNYADDIIQNRWKGGEYVTKENAAQFAADVLMFVRRRFFDVLEDEDRLLAAQGRSVPRDSPDGSNRTLKLENMKWVYDSKIKPLAERHRKELFRCGACDGNSKYYALDAVIQHYAAKHTSALSYGSAVVYWKSEWPAEPPFDPEPMSKPSRGYDTQSVYAASPMYTQEAAPSFLHERFAAHLEPTQSETFKGMYGLQNPPLSRGRNPGSVYGVEEDGTKRGPPFMPTQQSSSMHPTYNNGYVHDANYATSLPPSSPAFTTHGLPQYPQIQYTSGIGPTPGLLQRQGNVPNKGIISVSNQGFPAMQGVSQNPLQGQNGGIYRVQSEDLARNAREVWEGTEGIQDLPNSVRTHVIIHHVVLRFSAKYTNEPNLALFTDGLDHNPQMKPLKGLARLTCKACVSLQKNIEPGPDGLTASDIIQEVYTLPELLKHFQFLHVENSAPRAMAQTGLEIPRPDWKFDMIQLPEDSIITNLMHSPGITFLKLNLIATVLPRCFPQPLPRAGSPKPGGRNNSTTALDHHMSGDAVNSIPRQVDRHASMDLSPVLGRQVELVGEDEYDPHRPAPTYYVARRQDGDSRVPVYDGHDPEYSHYGRVIRHRDAYAPTHERYVQNGRPIRVVYPEDNYRIPPRRDIAPRRFYYPDEEPERYLRYSPIRSRAVARPYEGYDKVMVGARDNKRLQSHEDFVKKEAQQSPMQEPVSAAERFLNNFDNMPESYDDAHHRNLESQNGALDRASHNASSARGVRDFEESNRRDRDLLDEFDNSRTGLSSTRGTPRDLLPMSAASARSRSPLPLPQPDSPEDQAYSPRIPEVQTYLRGGESTGTQDLHAQETQGQIRPPLIEYDGDNYLGQERKYADRHPIDRPMYRDPRASPPRREDSNEYVNGSPELGRREYRAQYSEELPRSRYRRADEDLYEPPPREPVQYVQVMPRERYPSGEYYVERMGHRGVLPQYIEPDRNFDREILYEHDGQFYRAPPSRRNARYEIYGDGPYP